MKLLVFSDTHGNAAPMLDAAGRETDANACFFLGDGVRDAQLLAEKHPALPLYVVRGNCDLAAPDPTEGLVPFGDLLLFYAHGHTLSVKMDLERLFWMATRRGADIALFGHTHTPHYECRDGLHLFNPGSIGQPRGGPPTYGIVTIREDVPEFRIVEYKP